MATAAVSVLPTEQYPTDIKTWSRVSLEELFLDWQRPRMLPYAHVSYTDGPTKKRAHSRWPIPLDGFMQWGTACWPPPFIDQLCELQCRYFLRWTELDRTIGGFTQSHYLREGVPASELLDKRAMRGGIDIGAAAQVLAMAPIYSEPKGKDWSGLALFGVVWVKPEPPATELLAEQGWFSLQMFMRPAQNGCYLDSIADVALEFFRDPTQWPLALFDATRERVSGEILDDEQAWTLRKHTIPGEPLRTTVKETSVFPLCDSFAGAPYADFPDGAKEVTTAIHELGPRPGGVFWVNALTRDEANGVEVGGAVAAGAGGSAAMGSSAAASSFSQAAAAPPRGRDKGDVVAAALAAVHAMAAAQALAGPKPLPALIAAVAGRRGGRGSRGGGIGAGLRGGGSRGRGRSGRSAASVAPADGGAAAEQPLGPLADAALEYDGTGNYSRGRSGGGAAGGDSGALEPAGMLLLGDCAGSSFAAPQPPAPKRQRSDITDPDATAAAVAAAGAGSGGMFFSTDAADAADGGYRGGRGDAADGGADAAAFFHGAFDGDSLGLSVGDARHASGSSSAASSAAAAAAGRAAAPHQAGQHHSLPPQQQQQKPRARPRPPATVAAAMRALADEVAGLGGSAAANAELLAEAVILRRELAASRAQVADLQRRLEAATSQTAAVCGMLEASHR